MSGRHGDGSHWFDVLAGKLGQGIRKNWIDRNARRQFLWRGSDSSCRGPRQRAHDNEEVADMQAGVSFEIEKADLVLLAERLCIR